MISTGWAMPKLAAVSYNGDLISAQVIDNLSRARTASELIFMACVIFAIVRIRSHIRTCAIPAFRNCPSSR